MHMTTEELVRLLHRVGHKRRRFSTSDIGPMRIRLETTSPLLIRATHGIHLAVRVAALDPDPASVPVPPHQRGRLDPFLWWRSSDGILAILSPWKGRKTHDSLTIAR